MPASHKQGLHTIIFTTFLAIVVLGAAIGNTFAQGVDKGCSGTVANPCGGSPSSGSRRSAPSSPRSDPAEEARDRRHSEAIAANNRGIAFQKQGEHAKSVAAFQEAADRLPDDEVIRQNLADAKIWLERQLAKERKERKEREAAEAKRRDKAAADNMQQSIQDFAKTLKAAPSTGGLDFDGGKSGTPPGGGGLDFISPTPTAGAPKPAAALEFGDPMVVDARNLPSGLPPGVHKAIAGVFADAPPGVSDRVRKGFQAVMDRDWKVASAWFEDALSHDPGNVALKNLVIAANSSPLAAPAKPAPKLTTAQGLQVPRDGEVKLLFDPRSRAQVIADEVFMETIDPGWKKFNADERSASLKAAQAGGDAKHIRLLQDMYKAYDLEKSRVGRVAAPAPAATGAPVATPFLQLLLDAITRPEKLRGPSKTVAAPRG